MIETERQAIVQRLETLVQDVTAGRKTRSEAILEVPPQTLQRLLVPYAVVTEKDLKTRALTTGRLVHPGAAAGRLALDGDAAARLVLEGQPTILLSSRTWPREGAVVANSAGVVCAASGGLWKAGFAARQWGVPAIEEPLNLEVDLEARTAKVGIWTLREGERLTLDATGGRLLRGALKIETPEGLPDAALQLLTWADEARRLKVYANADTAEDAALAFKMGAEGIGLCRIERMMGAIGHAPAVREAIQAHGTGEYEAKVAVFQEALTRGLKLLFAACGNRKVIVRMLDAPLHQTLPHGSDWTESNPMLGLRAIRLWQALPELQNAQVAALREASEATGVVPHVLVPGVISGAELALAAEALKPFPVGPLAEFPRACLVARELADVSDFFCFGTNDLTQMTLAMSRDDAQFNVVPLYLRAGLLPADPFQSLDPQGVGELIRIAMTGIRASKPDIEVGICGEQGGDPSSLAFIHSLGLTYTSCSPWRVPVARLAAAHAALS